MINDWQHKENQTALAELREKGFSFRITADSYEIRYQDKFVHGAGVMLPRERKQHWRQIKANIRNYTAYCVYAARQHLQKISTTV